MLYANHLSNPEYQRMTLKALLDLWAELLGKPRRNRYLLSQSVKVIKGEKLGYLTGVLYMTNALKIGGINSCSHADLAGCKEPCLVGSGQMAGDTAIEARLDRIKLLTKNPALFFEILSREIKALNARAGRKSFRPVVRLNGTTDLDWTRITFDGKTIFQHFPLLRFYDYTKNPKLAENYQRHGICITFSYYKKAKTEDLLKLLDRGVNVAIAYRDRVPTGQMIGSRSVPVINGDEHDLRFLDQVGVVVGLRYKNQSMHRKAREINQTAHQSGFIIFSGTEIQ